MLAIRASPIAVASSSCKPGDGVVDRRAVERRRDLDGDRAAERHQPDLHVVGDLVDEVVAACWAAANRFGATSVASIDSDTSRATTIRPSLTIRSVVVVIGRAMAITPADRPSNCSAATT